MKNKLEIALLTIPLLLQGCATATKSSLLGVFVGGTVGGVVGKQSDISDASLNGALIGASLGGLIAYLAHKQKEKESTPGPPTKNLEDSFPALTQPKLRSIWVPDKIEGNKYIKGHQIFILEESGTWKKE